MNDLWKEKHRLAYTAPDFTIDQIDLDILLDETVQQLSQTSLVGASAIINNLLVNGESVHFVVLVDKNRLIYRVENNQLWIENTPDQFELQIRDRN